MLDARFAAFADVLNEDPDFLGADSKIHRPTDSRWEFRIVGCPVRNIASRGHFERAKQADIDMTATDHHERVTMMHVAATGDQRRIVLVAVNQVFLALAGFSCAPKAKHAVLAV